MTKSMIRPRRHLATILVLWCCISGSLINSVAAIDRYFPFGQAAHQVPEGLGIAGNWANLVGLTTFTIDLLQKVMSYQPPTKGFQIDVTNDLPWDLDAPVLSPVWGASIWDAPPGIVSGTTSSIIMQGITVQEWFGSVFGALAEVWYLAFSVDFPILDDNFNSMPLSLNLYHHTLTGQLDSPVVWLKVLDKPSSWMDWSVRKNISANYQDSWPKVEGTVYTQAVNDKVMAQYRLSQFKDGFPSKIAVRLYLKENTFTGTYTLSADTSATPFLRKDTVTGSTSVIQTTTRDNQVEWKLTRLWDDFYTIGLTSAPGMVMAITNDPSSPDINVNLVSESSLQGIAVNTKIWRIGRKNPKDDDVNLYYIQNFDGRVLSHKCDNTAKVQVMKPDTEADLACLGFYIEKY